MSPAVRGDDLSLNSNLRGKQFVEQFQDHGRRLAADAIQLFDDSDPVDSAELVEDHLA